MHNGIFLWCLSGQNVNQLDSDHGLTDLGSECGYQPVKNYLEYNKFHSTALMLTLKRNSRTTSWNGMISGRLRLDIYARIQRGCRVSEPPWKNHKNIGFPSNIDLDPLKIQCSAIIGTPAKRHLMAFRWRAENGVSLACRWPAYSDTWILPPPSTKKKLSVLGPLWQNFLDPPMTLPRLCTHRRTYQEINWL